MPTAELDELEQLSCLLRGQDVTQLQNFREDVLGKVLAYDRNCNAELVATLEAYFASNCSPQAAAERLGAHRNTVLYRLRRIEAIAGLNLGDPATRLLLHLALRLDRVIGLDTASVS